MFYVLKLLTNTQGQDASTVTAFSDETAALVHYHQMLSAYHNAADVYYAVVEVLESNGNCKTKEIVNHIPEPEPEPEPEEETTPEEEVTE